MAKEFKDFNMPKEEGFDTYYNPNCETIFQLGQYKILPQDYANFLIKSVDALTDILKQHHEAFSLDDISERSVAKLAEANLEATEEDISFFGAISSPINLYLSARLNFLKPESSDRIPEEVYQSREYTQDFFNPYRHGDSISFENFREEIPSRLETLQKKLSEYYPHGTIPAGLFRLKAKEKDDIHKFVNEFRFTLGLESISTNHLETSITLMNYGSVSIGKMDNPVCIPAISIKAEMIGGTLVLPKKIIKTLGEVVQEQYKELGDIEHIQSYTENRHR